MENQGWNKKDIGWRVLFSDASGKLGDVAILKCYEQIPNTIMVIDHPISLYSKIYLLGLSKEQEKVAPYILEKIGDWFYMEKVSKDVREELDRIASVERVFLEQS